MAADAKAKKDAKEAEAKVESNQKKGTQPSHAMKDYEGLYHHPGYGTAEIMTANDSLFMLVPGKKCGYGIIIMMCFKHYL